MRKEVTEEIANLLIEKLNEYTAGNNPVFLSRIPKNYNSTKPYRGINTLILSFRELKERYDFSEWVTLKQWNEKGGKIRKGEKATNIVYWQPVSKEIEVKDEETDSVKKIESSYCIGRTYSVFNRSQVEGLEEAKESTPEETDSDKEAEAMKFFNSSAKIVTVDGDMSFDKETIYIRDRSTFNSTEDYIAALSYLTANKLGGCKDEKLVPIKELVSEIAAGFISGYLGYNYKFSDQNLHRINAWISFIGGNKGVVFKACAEAQRVLDMFINNHSNTEDLLGNI